MAHRTFVVEDDPASAAHFSAVVSAMPELSLIGQVDTIAAARAQLDDELPDLLLTDLGLPDGNGIELITSLRKRSVRAEIVVISVMSTNAWRSASAIASRSTEGCSMSDSVETRLLPIPSCISRMIRSRSPTRTRSFSSLRNRS